LGGGAVFVTASLGDKDEIPVPERIETIYRRKLLRVNIWIFTQAASGLRIRNTC